ncbi:MAG: endoglucanase, partial [Frankiales bacterium]|nr:endoglucanase [Frankiales bacterium]
DRARELNLPVYMGETGENNPDWLMTAFQLYDDCGMSWNLWPWKKIETLTSPASVDAPAGWDALVAYGRGTGPKPAPDDAWRVLTDLLDAFAIDNCTYRTEVVNATLRRAPLRLVPWAFSFRGEGSSYGAEGRTASGTPLAGFRGNDRVTLECAAVNDNGEPPFQHNDGAPRTAEQAISVRLDAGEWVAYDVVVEDGRLCVTVAVDIAGDSSATVRLAVDGVPLTAGGRENGVVSAEGPVSAGTRVLRVTAVGGAVTLRWIDVTAA